MIVLSPEDLEYLNARYGIHYPVRAPTILLNKSGTKAVVKWSASWVGGTLYFTKRRDGTWTSEVVSSWIT